MTPFRNTIIHADCIKALPMLPDKSVDFILTDPPYITNYRARDGRRVPGDDNDRWLKPAFAQMYRRADNDDADGGKHLRSITRFDLVEWRNQWGNSETDRIDILDLGYWHTDPKTNEIAFEPPDANWRSEIAEILRQRRAAAGGTDGGAG